MQSEPGGGSKELSTGGIKGTGIGLKNQRRYQPGLEIIPSNPGDMEQMWGHRMSSIGVTLLRNRTAKHDKTSQIKSYCKLMYKER